MELKFYIQGSAINPYEIVFNTDNGITASCSCPAGEKKIMCKHVLSLIEGDTTNLLQEKSDALQLLRDAFLASEAKSTYDEWQSCVKELAIIDRKTKKSKRDFTRIFLGS